MKKCVGLLFLCCLFSVGSGKIKNKSYKYTKNGRSAVEKFGVPFHEGMKNSYWYYPELVEEDTWWQQAKNLYDTYVINKVEHAEHVRIPKIIHQIWIGSPLPEKYYHWQKSWQIRHPDWKYILWTDKDIEEFGLTNKHWYDQTTNYAQKADIARYEILYREGGLYVDTDFECIHSFDIFHHTCDFYAGIMQWKEGFRLCNALIGSAPGHPILKACIENINLDREYDSDPRINITYTTGPWHLTNCFNKEALRGKRVVAFPVGYFYPWPWYKRKRGQDAKNRRRKIVRWAKKETFAIHHWEESWFDQPSE